MEYPRPSSLSLKDLNKYADEVQNHIYKCKCGHSVLISRKKIKELCNWCGNYVYRNARDEFKDRLGVKLNGRKD